MAKSKEKSPEKYTQPATLTNVEIQEVNVEEVFAIIKNGNHYLIAVTNQVVSKHTFATVDEARTYIQSKPWELILNTAAVMMTKLNELKK